VFDPKVLVFDVVDVEAPGTLGGVVGGVVERGLDMRTGL